MSDDTKYSVPIDELDLMIQYGELSNELKIKAYHAGAMWSISNELSRIADVLSNDKPVNTFYRKTRNKITSSLRKEVFKRDNYTCVECNASVNDDGVRIHVDHITPISEGGTDDLENLQTLCDKCNFAKSNRIYKNKGD